MKEKEKKITKLPNEFHRHHRWQRGLIQESKKIYRRKSKHKEDYNKY